MENKIGEIVTLPPADIEARVVEDNSCDGCYYKDYRNLCVDYQDIGMLGECSWRRRKDRKNIIYKSLSAEEEEE